MRLRRLGSSGPQVSEIGLGCMGMSGMYGPADRAESIATIHAALDAAINLLDTGDFYGMGHNELLIAEATRTRPREDYLLSVKFGAQRGPDGAWLGYDARPSAVKTALAHSLTRLGVEHLDIYRPARLDPDVPIEETVGAIAELVQAGYVRHIGLSEVGPEMIRRAAATHPICDLQIEYSLISRGIEAAILPACRELGIAITAYGVLSRGLISGHFAPDRELAANDFRARAPRFQGANREHNLALVERSARSPRPSGLPSPRSRSPGPSHAARTSSRSSARAPPSGCKRRSVRWKSSSIPRTSPRSSAPCRPMPPSASATPSSRWPCSTASAAEPPLALPVCWRAEPGQRERPRGHLQWTAGTSGAGCPCARYAPFSDATASA